MPRPATALALLVSGTSAAQDSTQGVALPVGELVSGLTYVSLSQEVSGARHVIDNGTDPSDDTHSWVFKLPWEADLDVGPASGTLYLEAVAGYREAQDALHVPTLAGLAELRTRWRSIGGLPGVGWTQSIDEHWSVRPSVALALSDLRNDTSHNQLAADLYAELCNGVLFNRDAVALSL